MAGSAGAQPQPTLGQAQAKLKQLTYKENWLIQRYDQATQDLASARQRLALVNREVSRDMVAVKGMQEQIAQIASNVYENGSMTSPAALLTAGDPQTLLSQSAFLTHLSSDNYQQLQAFLTTDRQLTGARQMAKRTESAVAAVEAPRPPPPGRRRRPSRSPSPSSAVPTSSGPPGPARPGWTAPG